MPAESRSNRNHEAPCADRTQDGCRRIPFRKAPAPIRLNLASRLFPRGGAAGRSGATLWVLPLLALPFAVLLAVPLTASSVSQGSIQGVVRDVSGRRVTGARIVLEPGDEIHPATTGPDGAYHFSAVPPGAYSLRVHCPGYSLLKRSGVRLTAGETLTVNLVLHVLPSLGRVQFYSNSHFTAAELENPAAGGGYSDAASTQGARMVRQYIFSGAPRQRANSSEPTPAAAEPSLRSAEALLVRRDFTGAAGEFGIALRRNPRSGRAAAGLGLALYGEGKYTAAIDALERAATLAPADPAPPMLMAEAARFAPARQPEVARRLAAFAAGHAASASGHYAYAIVLWELFRHNHDPQTFALARAECERAASLNPGNAGALNQLGVIYDHQGRWADAVSAYRKASRLDPDRASTRYRLARDLFREGRTEQARGEMKIYETLRSRASK